MKAFLLLLGFILFTAAQNSKDLMENLNKIEICATLNNVNRTFANIWEIYQEFKNTGAVWTPVARGPCVANSLDCMILNPVCAITNNFIQKTFPNKCILEADQKSSGIEWHIIYNGICPTNDEDGSVAPTLVPSRPPSEPSYKKERVPYVSDKSVPYVSKSYEAQKYPVPVTPPESAVASTPSSSTQYLVPSTTCAPSLENFGKASYPSPISQSNTNKYIQQPIVNAEPLSQSKSEANYVPLNTLPATNNFSPPIPMSNRVSQANRYHHSNIPQPLQNEYPASVYSQESSQSSAISQLYNALVNYFESLPKQESLGVSYVPVSSPVGSSTLDSPPPNLKGNKHTGSGEQYPQSNNTPKEKGSSYSNSPEDYKEPIGPLCSGFEEIQSAKSEFAHNNGNYSSYPIVEKPSDAPPAEPAYEIATKKYASNASNNCDQSDNVLDAPLNVAAFANLLTSNLTSTKNYEAASYNNRATNPLVLSASNNYEMPYTAVDTEILYTNSENGQDIKSYAENYKDLSYVASSENINSIPDKIYKTSADTSSLYEASNNPAAVEITPKSSCKNYKRNYEILSAIENHLPSYTNPAKSFQIPLDSTPAESPTPADPSYISYKSTSDEKSSCSCRDDNSEDPSYTASYKNYAASEEEPFPSHLSPSDNYETPPHSPSDIPEEIEPCNNADLPYSSPVFNYNSLPSYFEKAYKGPSSNDSDSYSTNENVGTSQSQEYTLESDNQNPAEQSELNPNTEGRTIYNGVVYQGPYHYEPKYKQINYGNFNFLPAQGSTKDKVAHSAPALVTAYVYPNTLPVSQYKAPFERLLQYIASKNV